MLSKPSAIFLKTVWLVGSGAFSLVTLLLFWHLRNAQTFTDAMHGWEQLSACSIATILWSAVGFYWFRRRARVR
jgi:hypothetical protein